MQTTHCTYMWARFSAPNVYVQLIARSPRSASLLVRGRPSSGNGPGAMALLSWSVPATCNFAAHAARACSRRDFKCRNSMRLLLQVS